MNRRKVPMMWIFIWSAVVIVAIGGLTLSINNRRFAAAVTRDARQMWAGCQSAVASYRWSLDDLPAPVRRYVVAAGADQHPVVRTVRLQHGGTFQMKPDAKPTGIRGTQYFCADPPGFVWWGRVRLGPGLWMDARDKVIAGAGAMTVKLDSTLTVGDVRGPELDQSALVRLLGELVWLPTTFLDRRHVSWEALDAHRARARLRVGGQEVGAVFHFGADGLPERVTAERHRDVGGGKSVLTPFVGSLSDWRSVDGLRVPFQLEGAWIIDGQPFRFAHFVVDRFEPGVAEAFVTSGEAR